MNFVFSIDITLLIISVVFNVILAALVLRNSTKSATNRIFAVLCLVLTLWLIANHFSLDPRFVGSSLFLIRLTLFFAVPMTMLFFLLASTIPSEVFLLSRRSLMIILIVTAIVMILTVSPFVFSGVDISQGVPKPIPGPGMPAFAALTTFFDVAAVYVLFRRLKMAREVERHQLRLVVTGILIMLGLIVGTVFIPVVAFKTNTFVPIMPIYTLIFLGMTTYAIVKYGLFDLKVIVTELVMVFLILLLLLNLLSSATGIAFIFNFFVFLAVFGIGMALIKSVRREVKRREEMAHLARKLEKANFRLKELDHIKTEFLSIASHQLRTPLTAIKGYVSLILEGAYGEIEPKLKEVLNNTYESNEHLIHLVDDFLGISRIEQGRTKYDFSKVDIVHTAKNIVTDLMVQADKKNLKLTLALPRGVKKAQVTADPEKVHHVIYNFVDNAIKYTEKGFVKVKFEQQRNGWAVKVQDSGMGFGKEDEANFFQKFYRGKNAQSAHVNGTGLGLYVCRKFIEGHGGQIWCKSRGYGRGSEFGFWLPPKPKI